MATLQGKNYVVVGASTGIGLALAKQLVAQGATVYTYSRTLSPELQALGTHYQVLDVTTATAEAYANLPASIDGLAYCPGTINLKPLQRLTIDDFTKDYQVNVLGAITAIQAASKGLKAAQGAIVLFSTVAVQTGMSFHASIAAAKGAIEGLTRSLAAEFAPAKIRVNAIAPSLTDTPLAGALLNSPEKKEASDKRHPLGRVGNADELASAAAFLLGPESTWITGQIIGIDGGMGRLK